MTDLDPAETSSINKVFSFDTYHIKVCDYLVRSAFDRSKTGNARISRIVSSG